MRDMAGESGKYQTRRSTGCFLFGNVHEFPSLFRGIANMRTTERLAVERAERP